LLLVYVVIRSSEWLERKLGPAGVGILQKIFGVVLLAIAIKLFKKNLGL
jgi:multiple antibiotic resistance protein